jgi:hypothetical protein
MNWTKVPVVPLSIKLESDPAMFSATLHAPLLASHVATVVRADAATRRARKAELFDHLVGAGEQGRWNGNTEGPCGLTDFL